MSSASIRSLSCASLHEAVLREEVALPAHVPGGPPALLPPDVTDFTGRAAEAQRLLRLLSSPDRPATVAVSALAGKPGIGKTALAVHVAHRVRRLYGDGQLFVDLQGVEHLIVARDLLSAQIPTPLRELGWCLQALATAYAGAGDPASAADARRDAAGLIDGR